MSRQADAEEIRKAYRKLAVTILDGKLPITITRLRQGYGGQASKITITRF